MRQLWLKENKRLVAQDNFGNDLAAVEAAMKKHEAIESDIDVRCNFLLVQYLVVMFHVSCDAMWAKHY